MGIRKGLGRNSSTLTQDQLTLEGPWKREETSALTYTFRGDEPGPSIPVDSSISAMEFIFFFIDELITTETNRLCCQIEGTESPHLSSYLGLCDGNEGLYRDFDSYRYL